MILSRSSSASKHHHNTATLPSINTATTRTHRFCQPGALKYKSPLNRRAHSVAAAQHIRLSKSRKMADVKAILAGKYPAKAHARRVVEWMRAKNPGVSGVLYLEGQKTRMIEDNDETQPFRSCSFPTSLDPSLLTTTTPGNVGTSTT